MPTFFINSDSFKASNAFVATLGAAPGSTYLGQIISAGLPTAANAMLAAMSATTAATRADAIAANLGLTGAAATSAASYLTTVTFAGAASTHGQALLNALDLFTTLQNDATYGTAATAYVARVNTALSYSSVAANNSTDLTTLAAAIGAAGSSGAGSTFTLTTGVDNPAFTSGNDTVNSTIITGTAASTTLNVFDTINAGAGTDTLNINYGNTVATIAASAIPTLTGVEVINVSGLGGNSTMTGSIAPSLTTLNVANVLTASVLAVSATPSTATTFGLSSIATDDSDLNITYATGAMGGAADSVTLNITGVNSATNNAAKSSDFTTVGAATGFGIEVVNVVSTPTSSATGSRLGTLSATNGATSTMTTLNVSGTGGLRVWNTLDFKDTAGTINAASATGAIDLQVGTENITYTGGSGNDVLRFATAGDLDVNDSINLGAGDDTIVLADTSITTTTTALNTAITATGAEIIGFSAAGTSVDMSAVAASKVASYQSANGNLTFTKLLSSDTVIISTGVTSTAADVIVSGQLGFTTANVQLAGSSTASVSIDDLTAQNLATLNIESAGTASAVNTLDNLVLSDNTVVTLTGAQGLTITNALANTAVVINGSALTKALTVTAGTSGSSLVGGAGDDVLTGGTGVDTIVGGAGNDTINTGVDAGATGGSVTGGLGSDAITLGNVTTAALAYGLNVTAAESYATGGQFDTVTSGAIENTDSNVITLTTGVLSSTLTAATSVTVGTTVVTAGQFLVVAATAALTATSQNISLYQDSNSNGVIDATDLRVDFAKTGNDTIAVAIVGSKAVVTVAGVTDA